MNQLDKGLNQLDKGLNQLDKGLNQLDKGLNRSDKGQNRQNKCLIRSEKDQNILGLSIILNQISRQMREKLIQSWNLILIEYPTSPADISSQT